MPRLAHLAAAALVAVVAVGCSRERSDDRRLPDDVLRVHLDRLVLAHGTIGAGRLAGPGTYVLVDAENTLDTDVHVTLVGDLVDANGAPIASLVPDTLRIPPRGVRTFALVHLRDEIRGAASAAIRVGDVRAATERPAIEITDGNVYRDGDRVIVAGNLVNRTKHEAIVLVMAGFYDGDGRIMRRPFSAMSIPGGATRPARFVGPDGSAKGYLFVGSETF
jgi:hypothetical protein